MRILLTGNTCFKIANFREGLVRALQAQGHEVLVLGPADAYRPNLEAMGCQVHDLPMDTRDLSLSKIRFSCGQFCLISHSIERSISRPVHAQLPSESDLMFQ